MIRGILHNGVIQPLDPLPGNWTDGTQVQVEEVACLHAEIACRFEKWRDEVEAGAAKIDPQEIIRLDAALVEADREAKELMHRRMGL